MPDGDGARDIEAAVFAQLEALGEPYERLACDPALADTASFCAHYGVSPDESGNCIIVASKREPKQYSACLVLATTRLDVNQTVKRLMGAGRLSFASPDETVALTGMLIGGVTPFALPAGLALYIDAHVLESERVWVGGGSRSLKIAVAPSVFKALPGAVVVEGLAVPVAVS